MNARGERSIDRGARLSGLIHEIIAEELQAIDDERLELVAVTDVRVDRELTSAIVSYSMIDGSESGSDVAAALDSHRVEIQSAIGRQARLRRVPRVEFRKDEVLARAARIDAILDDLASGDDTSASDR